TSFQRRSSIVYIVSVKTKTHFEAKCIAGSQTNWFNAEVFSGFHYFVPDLFHFVVFTINFKTTASRITGCADDYVFNSRKISNFKMIEFYSTQIFRSQ